MWATYTSMLGNCQIDHGTPSIILGLKRASCLTGNHAF
jgi:hypothetical protein